MASKDIFGKGNPEELFDSSLLDSSQEDTYGLNAGNKVDSAGTDPLTAEIQRLSTNNINIEYSTDNIGGDTDSLVSSPSLFNQTSAQNQLFGQQATDFNKTDIDNDFNKTSIDSLTGNNKDNPLVGNPELKLFIENNDNSTSPTPQSIVPQAPGDITELKFVQDKSKLKVFENGGLVEEVKAKQNQAVPFTIERIQITALNSNDLPKVLNDNSFHDNGEGIGITDGNDGNSSLKKRIDKNEILQIKIQPTDNYNSAFSATVGVDRVEAIANKSSGGKVKIVAMRGATAVGEQIYNISNKKEQLTFTNDTAFDRLHLMAGDDNTKFTFRSTQFQAVVTPSPQLTYLEFAPDELGINITENGSVVEQFSVGENQPVPNSSSRLEVNAVDSQDDGSVLDATNYFSAEGIGIIDGDDNTEVLQKRIDGDEKLEFKIKSTDNYNSASSATVALDKIKSVRANNGTVFDGGAVKILALRDDVLVGGKTYTFEEETEEVFFLSNQPFDKLQIQAGNDETQFTLRSIDLESVTTSPLPTASLKFVQDRLRLNVFENEVLTNQVRGRQNQSIPDAFERIEVSAVDSSDGSTVKVDSTFLDNGEGIGITDGQDGNSSLKKKIDGDEILQFKIKPTESYETANQALISVDRVSAIDSKKNGGKVKVVALREGNIVSEQTYTIANKNQKLSFASDNAFDTLQLQAGDNNTKFSFRYIDFGLVVNVPNNTDTEAPSISAALANDTAPNNATNNDGITFDATIVGTVTDTSQIVEFIAGLDDTPVADYENVLPQLKEDGGFTISQTALEQINGGVLTPGSHALHLQAVDAFGNQSDVFDIAFTLDSDTAEPTLSLLPTSDSGNSNTDNITNDTVPIITGNAEAGSVVQLFQAGEPDNQLVGETTADDTGNWQIATNNLADGTYDFSAIATDIAGNTNASATPLQLTVDTTQPTINFTTSIDTEPLASGARLTGNLDGTGSDIAAISYRFNDGAEIAVTFDDTGAFDQEFDFTGINDGDYTLTVTITDAAGNVSTIPYNIIIASPSEITAALANDTAPDNTTNSDSITSDATVSGNISNFGDRLRLRAGFGDTSVEDYVDITELVNSGGNFNLYLSQLSNINRASLEDGAYSLNLLLEDLQGNELSNSAVNFTLDTSNPVLELKTPVDSGEHSSKSRLIGNVSDTGSGLFDTSYSLDGQASSPLTISNQGAFDQALVPTGLTNGDHNLTLSVFDVAGNFTQTSANFTVSDDFIIGSTDTVGWGIKTADGVILGEQNSFVTQTAMEIDLGQDEGKRQLEFEIDAQFDTSDTNTASEDRLSLYLVDSFSPEITLLDQGEPGTALFSLSGTDAEFTPGLVNYDGNRVRVDLTSLEGQTSGSLVFQLINNDSDTGSVVQIKDITNTVDTEAIAGPVFPTDIERATVGEEVNLDNFNTTTDVELLLSNVRLDSDTGTYTADLQVRNNGTTTLGRELVVALTNLPDGVSLNNASGSDSENSPYINLSNAIRPGGLNPQAISDAVQIVFDNPSLTRFDLQPVFYAGALEQPPQLSPIESQSVMPGERLEIPLIATDPNGDPISYSLRSDTPLPKGELTGDGTLIFTPAPEDIGTYNFTVIATAGEVDVTQDVTITVEPDPITTTRVSGVIENTDQEALAGVVIELGGLQTTTDANGYFQLEVDGELPSDTLKVRAELLGGDDAYPFIAEKLPLVLEHEVYEGVNNIINRPIYLPVLDTENGVVVDPNTDTTVTTDTIPGASVFVEAGSLDDQQGNPFTGNLSITEVPPDLTPAALPENLRPDVVVTIQPGEMVFNTPAPLALPNRAGYVPGLEMDLWSINPNTGLFDKVGVGRVSDDGSVIETIEGGIRNSSWHFFAPPEGDPNDPDDDPRNEDEECNKCEDKKKINSEVESHSGAVTENHDLVTYQSLGETRGLTLNYHSLRADPRQIVHFGYDNVQVVSQNSNRMVAKLEVKKGDFTYQVTGSTPGKNGLASGEHVWGIPQSGGNIDAALQMDMRSLSSGKYEYELTTGLQVFTGTGFNGSSRTITSEIISVNTIDSAFGSGWGLAGLQEIVENDDGSLLLIDGDGTQLLFETPIQTGGFYISPGGDFSNLERLVDGTFRRTMEDGIVYQFSTQNKLELVRDSNGNETQYQYNTEGQISKVIDSVGLETTFAYTNGRVSSITDPGNRVTELEYDTKGNLVKITDPDNSSRSWEYDNSHRMTAAIDKRGNRGEDIYNAYGRVIRAIRPDGSVVRVDPVQTQGLYRSTQTVNPFDAPLAEELGDADASYADGNGNVTRTRLDQAGQLVSSQDGVGFLPSVERNENNLVTKSTNGRNNATNYTYDTRGNVLTVKDELSQFFTGPVDFGTNNLFPNRIYKTGDNPQQIVAADLNGDGHVDVVTANRDSNNISVLLGDGTGIFSTPNNYTVGSSPNSLVLLDIDGDEKLDLVTANRDSNNISVLFGNGLGTFSTPTNYTVGSAPSSIDGADINSDGLLDLAVANRDSNNLSLLLGSETETFSPAISLNLASQPNRVTFDDFNDDGQADIAVTTGLSNGNNGVSVLLNNGNGTFSSQTDYAVGNFPVGVTSGDISGSGKVDIVTTNYESHDVSVLPNLGNGTFGTKTDYAVGYSPTSVVLGDVNADNNVDIITANVSDNTVSVLLNNGSGGFTPKTNYTVGSAPSSITLADANSDGTVDVIAANSIDSSISVLFGDGNGTFNPRVEPLTNNYSAISAPQSVILHDVTYDGILDMVTNNPETNNVSVRFGNGDGSFSAEFNYDVGDNPQSVDVADVSGDGFVDLVVANTDSNSVSVLFNNGQGIFSATTDSIIEGRPNSIAVGDVDLDGKADLIVSKPRFDEISVLLGNGQGEFTTPTDISMGFTPTKVDISDLNGDGSLDIVVNSTDNVNNYISILLNDGNGNFGFHADYQVARGEEDFTIGDVNSDGSGDIITANSENKIIGVLLNEGNGTFSPKIDYAVGNSSVAVTLGDVNSDGKVDIISANSFDYSVSVLLGDGTGTYDPNNRLDFAVGNQPISIAVAELNGDGFQDLVTGNLNDNTVSVRLNQIANGEVSTGIGERRYTYDSTFSQVTSVTDELGRITLYDIDPNNGNMLSTTRVVGEVGGNDDEITSYTYTSDGQIDTMTDANGRVTDYDYNDFGRLIKTTFAVGTVDEAVQQFEYNAAGNLTAFIDENNNRTEYEYDELNRLIKTTYAKATTEEAVETFEYDDAGNQIATVDANNNRTEYEYDKMNQLVKTIEADPDGGGPLAAPITTYEYDSSGNLTSVVDPLKQETRYRYDSRDRLIETIYADNSRERLRYDFNDNIVATIDANGNRTSMVYDARNRLTRTTDALQNVTEYEYDVTDQLIAVTDANEHKTKYDYDDLGRQVAVTDARNGVTTTEYDFVGNVIAVTDANQNTTNFTYDNRDRQTIVTDAEQQITTTTYDDASNVISVTDAENDTTTFSYDARNRNISISDPLNRTTTYTYDDANNLIAVEDALNRVTEYEYDALNRNTIVENALGDTVVTTYDAADKVTSTTDELKRKTRYKYDKRNRLTTTIDPLNHQTKREYDGNGNLIELTDALNQTTVYEYDALDRQKKITDALSQVTSFTYDAVGNLETVTDPEQNTTTYTYDELDRLKTESNELGKLRSYDYDAVGNLIATTDRNQRQRSYTYDRVDRQKEEKWLDSQGNAIRTISYDYDKVGRLTNTFDPDSSYSYTYDSAGQLIKVDNAGTPGVNNVVLDYTYDAVGNLKTVTDTIDGTQSGLEEFTYDDLNRVTRITQSGNGVTDKRVDMTYDAASQLKGINRYADLAGTQLVADSSYDYDVASRLKELKHFKGTDVLAAYGFDYDAGNRITSFTSPDGTSTYSYDLTNQLTGTDHSYQDDESYSYDANGNRTNDGYDTGTDNRLLTDGKYNYSYDDEGNRTQRVEIATGEITEYSWDYRNRLTEVVVKDAVGNVIKTAGYAYDMFDRRIAKEVDADGDGVATASVERFVYDGEHIALTFDGDGNLTHRYLHGPQIDQILADENAQGEVLWALTDNQGTVRHVVDNSGTVVNHITYDSFGKVTGESNSNIDFRFGYTGREFDEETGQYYYRARYYDAAVGQFINQDPIGLNGGDVNLYRYVLNDPTNATDPSGLIPIRQLLGSDPTRYSGLPPWVERQDSYDEQQRQWALQIVKNNAKHICDTAQHYNVTPDAIAGAIFWEAVENPYGFWTRGANPLGNWTRPRKPGPNDFGIPGKIHVNPGSDAEAVEKKVRLRRPDVFPLPEYKLVPTGRGVGRNYRVPISKEDARRDILQQDYPLAIEYIGAILDRNATIYDNIVREATNKQRPYFSIRDQAGILGILYQGGFSKDRQDLVREKFTRNPKTAIPQFPLPSEPGERTEAMGPWVSQYRNWISNYLSECGCNEPAGPLPSLK